MVSSVQILLYRFICGIKFSSWHLKTKKYISHKNTLKTIIPLKWTSISEIQNQDLRSPNFKAFVLQLLVLKLWRISSWYELWTLAHSFKVHIFQKNVLFAINFVIPASFFSETNHFDEEENLNNNMFTFC